MNTAVRQPLGGAESPSASQPGAGAGEHRGQTGKLSDTPQLILPERFSPETLAPAGAALKVGRTGAGVERTPSGPLTSRLTMLSRGCHTQSSAGPQAAWPGSTTLPPQRALARRVTEKPCDDSPVGPQERLWSPAGAGGALQGWVRSRLLVGGCRALGRHSAAGRPWAACCPPWPMDTGRSARGCGPRPRLSAPVLVGGGCCQSPRPSSQLQPSPVGTALLRGRPSGPGGGDQVGAQGRGLGPPPERRPKSLHERAQGSHSGSCDRWDPFQAKHQAGGRAPSACADGNEVVNNAIYPPALPGSVC